MTQRGEKSFETSTEGGDDSKRREKREETHQLS
jgi:hypothetical protein